MVPNYAKRLSPVQSKVFSGGDDTGKSQYWWWIRQLDSGAR